MYQKRYANDEPPTVAKDVHIVIVGTLRELIINIQLPGIWWKRDACTLRCERFFLLKKKIHSYLEPPIQFEHCNQKCIYIPM